MFSLEFDGWVDFWIPFTIFSQNLIQRQNEIDTLMTNYALENWEIQKRTHVRKYNYKRMIKQASTYKAFQPF